MTRGSYTVSTTDLARLDPIFAAAPRPPPRDPLSGPITESDPIRGPNIFSNRIDEGDQLRGPNLFSQTNPFTGPITESDPIRGPNIFSNRIDEGDQLRGPGLADLLPRAPTSALTVRQNVSANLISASANPLNKYVTYNNLFTLACLTVEQQNTGVYNSQNISNIVVSSKGDWNDSGKRVTTSFGKFDYFIDDVIIANLVSLNERSGNSFAHKITFSVTEPYSIGLFLLALQEGARQGGYQNYREAAYLFVIEWAGYDDQNVASIDAGLTRYIPMKFIDVQMKVNQSGAIYQCEAVPYNEIAMRDSVSKIPTQITISGSKVDELLISENSDNNSGARSLITALRNFSQRQIAEGVLQNTDEYIIRFPKDFTDQTGNENDISKSVLFSGLEDNGTVPFPTNVAVFDTVRRIYQNRRVNVSEKRNFEYPANTKIEDIITDVVLRSDYIVEQLRDQRVYADPRGMINWFRIETQVIDLQTLNSRLNRQNRRYIYRVIPYKVHVHKFLAPNAIPNGVQNLIYDVQRIYDYTYTGKNTEILNINLDFKMGFFTELPADGARNTASTTPNSGISPRVQQPGPAIPTASAPQSNPSLGGTATTQTTGRDAGEFSSGRDDARTRQVKHLQAILQAEGDLIDLELEIRGDPYYVSSSGMGNQSSIAPRSYNLMSDGSFNYQSGEVDILVRFRTPLDLDPVSGLYKFAQEIDQLSGLFQILEVESKFNNNKFTQVVKLIRRRVQFGSSNVVGQSENTIVFETRE